MDLLDLIFPKYCVNCKKLGSYICSNCFSSISFSEYEECLVCNRASIDGLTHPGCKSRYSIDGVFTSILYKGVVKKLIQQFKYKPFVSDLKSFLVDLLYEGIIQKEQFIKAIESCKAESGSARHRLLNNETIVLAPIPLYKTRLKRRGYNQASLLADGLSDKLNIPIVDILIRVRNTTSQVSLKLKERKANISGAFSVAPHLLADGSQYPNIFLVDDVLTSGSTLLEAANVLKRNRAERVWGIALARD